MQLVLRHSWKVFQFTDSLIETPRPPLSLSVQVHIERAGGTNDVCRCGWDICGETYTTIWLSHAMKTLRQMDGGESNETKSEEREKEREGGKMK